LDVRIVNGRGAQAEIRADEKVDVFVNRAVKGWTDAAQNDRIRVANRARTKVGVIVDLQVRADVQDEIAVLGPDGEAGRISRGRSRVLAVAGGLSGLDLFLELVDLLLQLLNSLFGRLGLVLPPQRQ
jgi:hypothetical protein